MILYYLSTTGVETLFEELAQIPLLENLLLLNQLTPDMGKKNAYPEDVQTYLATRGYAISDKRLLGDLTQNYYQKIHGARWWVISALR